MQVFNTKGKVIGYVNKEDPTMVLLFDPEREIRIPVEWTRGRFDWYFLHKDSEGRRELISVQTVVEEGEIEGDEYAYKW